MSLDIYYMDTPNYMYVGFGAVVYKDKFYVYPDSDAVWYKFVLSRRTGTQELYVNVALTTSKDFCAGNIDFEDGANFRDYPGTELSPSSPDIAKYYKALYHAPASVFIKFRTVYVDTLSVLEICKFRGPRNNTTEVYAVRNSEDKTLVGYISATVVNGVVKYSQDSATHRYYVSTLRKLIGHITEGDIEVFTPSTRLHQGEYTVSGSYSTIGTDITRSAMDAWSDVFLDAAVAMVGEDQPRSISTTPQPTADGVIRWPDRFTMKNRKYTIHTDAIFQVGSYSIPFYMVTDNTAEDCFFSATTVPVTKDMDKSLWLTSDKIQWSKLSDSNCPDCFRKHFEDHTELTKCYANYIVMEKCYVDLSKVYVAYIPLVGNHKPVEPMSVYQVRYFHSDKVSYVSVYVTGDSEASARSLLYALNDTEPGVVLSSCRATYNVSDINISESVGQHAEQPVVAVPDPVNVVDDSREEEPQTSSVDDLTAKVTSVITFPESIHFSVTGRRDIVSVDKTKLFRVLADDPDDNVYLGAYTLKGYMLGLVKETDALSGKLCIYQTPYEQVTDPSDPKLSTEFKKAASAYARQYFYDSNSIYAGKATIHLSEYYDIRSGGRSSTAHRVSFEDSPECSYISTGAFCDVYTTRYFINLVVASAPGSYISSSREVYANGLYTCSFKCIDSYDCEDLSQWVRCDAVDSVDSVDAVADSVASVATVTDSTEKLYERIVPRLDSIDRTQDETRAAVKWNNGKLDDLHKCIEAGFTESKNQLTVVNEDIRRCLSITTEGFNERFDNMSDKFGSLGVGHSMMLELLHKVNKSTDEVKVSTDEHRTAIQGIIDVFQTSLEVMDKEFSESKDRQRSIAEVIDRLTYATQSVLEYQERILQNQERKGFWNWLKSLFKK